MIKNCKELHGTRLTPEKPVLYISDPKKGEYNPRHSGEALAAPLSKNPLSKSGDCKGNKSFRNKQNKNIFLSRKQPPNPKIQTLPRRGTTKINVFEHHFQILFHKKNK